MRIYQAEDYEGMSRKAANLISAQMLSKPASVLGLATGSTPVGTYKQLIEWYQRGDLDFSEIHSVNLDEYRGLAPTHDQSYRYFMQANLFDHVNINPEHTNVPDGLAEDAQAECCRYEALIDSLGGIDLQLLGIGHNGHIGFNEPCRIPEGNPRGRSDQKHDRRERAVFRERGRGAPSGADHGNPLHHAGA